MKNIWELFAVLAVTGGFAACNKEEDKPVEEDIRFVDLGLSVKWAKCYLGATSPKDMEIILPGAKQSRIMRKGMRRKQTA